MLNASSVHQLRHGTSDVTPCFLSHRVSPFVYNGHKKRYVIDANGWKWSTRSIPFGPEGRLDLGDGGRVSYFPRYFADADTIFQALKSEVPWEERKIHLFGKEIMQPRQISFMATDPSLSYTYSRVTLQPLALTPTVAKIQSILEELLKTTFNCVLLNHYRSGKDHMSWHADKERLFGPNPIIASVSLGHQRAFDLRNNARTSMRWRSIYTCHIIRLRSTAAFWML